MEKAAKPFLLSGNQLKIIAAVTMLIDHIGFILFPQYLILRVIGRIAFPIYAFMIAEGCAYTKNKRKYFLDIFSLALLCQIAYFLYDGSRDLGILVTFSLSILLIYTLEGIKERLFIKECPKKEKIIAVSVFLLGTLAVYLLNTRYRVDYGFWGCMAPVFASVFKNIKNAPSMLKKLDSIGMQVLMLAIALLILALTTYDIQLYSFLALPILFAYSGARGKLKMKRFFYIFYPSHLLILHIISHFMTR